MPNTHDDAPDALVVGIAQIIDHPSVYMGGPSRNSLRIAKMIVKEFGSDLCASGQQEAVTAARAEIERLTKERDLSKELLRSCIQGNNVLRKKAQKAIAERDEARSMLADAERDMRQRAANKVRNAAAAFYPYADEVVQALADDVLALPLKHADQEEGK